MATATTTLILVIAVVAICSFFAQRGNPQHPSHYVRNSEFPYGGNASLGKQFSGWAASSTHLYALQFSRYEIMEISNDFSSMKSIVGNSSQSSDNGELLDGPTDGREARLANRGDAPLAFQDGKLYFISMNSSFQAIYETDVAATNNPTNFVYGPSPRRDNSDVYQFTEKTLPSTATFQSLDFIASTKSERPGELVVAQHNVVYFYNVTSKVFTFIAGGYVAITTDGIGDSAGFYIYGIVYRKGMIYIRTTIGIGQINPTTQAFSTIVLDSFSKASLLSMEPISDRFISLHHRRTRIFDLETNLFVNVQDAPIVQGLVLPFNHSLGTGTITHSKSTFYSYELINVTASADHGVASIPNNSMFFATISSGFYDQLRPEEKAGIALVFLLLFVLVVVLIVVHCILPSNKNTQKR